MGFKNFLCLTYIFHVLATADESTAANFSHHHLITADIAPVFLIFFLYSHFQASLLKFLLPA